MAKRVPDFRSTLRRVAIALLVGAVLAGACSRRQTMASRSAAAYDEAVEKGLPIGSGHGGHGHGAVGSRSGEEPPEGDATPTSGMDHADHSAHSARAGADHHSMAGMDPSKRAERDPRSAPAKDHSRMDGHDQESPADRDHSKTHGEPPGVTAGADRHHATGTERPEKPAPDPSSLEAEKWAAPPGSDRPLEASDSNAEIIELDPAVTLRRDALDAPAPRSVSEAQKAGGAAHSDHGGAEEAPADPAPPAPPGHDHPSALPAPEGRR